VGEISSPEHHLEPRLIVSPEPLRSTDVRLLKAIEIPILGNLVREILDDRRFFWGFSGEGEGRPQQAVVQDAPRPAVRVTERVNPLEAMVRVGDESGDGQANTSARPRASAALRRSSISS
jgi:hypothetical protein